MSIEIQRQRRLRKNPNLKSFLIRTQWKSLWKREPVEDYGTFSQMIAKHGTEKFQYWCAQCPPEWSKEEGIWAGYRLDGEENTGFLKMKKSDWSLQRYGRHKAWISPTLKIQGKRVILVANAGGVSY